jgi:small subunit ribosomal protein S20
VRRVSKVVEPLDVATGRGYVSRSLLGMAGNGLPITSLIVPLEFYVPNIKSAKKDLRKSRAAAIRNKAQRSALRTAVKKAKTTKASADERLSAVSLLDRAARKGLIHRNTAARQKSNLAKRAAAAAA